jgi:hypothetical protein
MFAQVFFDGRWNAYELHSPTFGIMNSRFSFGGGKLPTVFTERWGVKNTSDKIVFFPQDVIISSGW